MEMITKQGKAKEELSDRWRTGKNKDKRLQELTAEAGSKPLDEARNTVMATAV